MSARALHPGTPAARGLALAAAAVILAVIWVGLAAPWLDRLQSGRQRLERQEALLRGYQQVAARDVEARARLDALTADPRGAGLWLAADSEGQAAAALQDRVKTVAAAAGAALISQQPLGTSAGPPRRTRLRVALAADTAVLQAVLHGLESGSPLLLIEGLTLRPRPGGAGGLLDVQIDLAGFGLGGSGRSASP
jgi:hypothetical protein